jgi:hypothetical protein
MKDCIGHVTEAFHTARFASSAGALAACLFAVSLAVPSAVQADPPNIVFFLVDDLGSADCGFAGGTEIKTPRIDALAAGGTILDALYVQPVCSPTRACLMTGRYPTRTGVYTIVRPHAPWGLPLAERTLADALKAAGALIGNTATISETSTTSRMSATASATGTAMTSRSRRRATRPT